MARSTAAALLSSVELDPVGPVSWGTAPRSSRSGVYVVETRAALAEAPVDDALVRAWLDRVPTLRLDGQRPTTEQLAGRLGEFWVPRQRIVYIGLTTASLARRLRAYYRTPLGDRKPHAGGHWIQTLGGIADFDVWWAESDTPGTFEDSLLAEFAELVPKTKRAQIPGSDVVMLPFANKQNSSGTLRKPHGISGAVLHDRASGSPVTSATPEPNPSPVQAVRPANASTARINGALQKIACSDPNRRVAAVPAAAELHRRRLLSDSQQRPGKPLRDLLRAGKIAHAYQESNGRWWIACTGDGD
jgi:hypothetical protein